MVAYELSVIVTLPEIIGNAMMKGGVEQEQDRWVTLFNYLANQAYTNPSNLTATLIPMVTPENSEVPF